MYWNKNRVGNDHIWIAPNLLYAGRSAISHRLEGYGYYPPWLEAEVHKPEYVRAEVLRIDVHLRDGEALDVSSIILHRHRSLLVALSDFDLVGAMLYIQV